MLLADYVDRYVSARRISRAATYLLRWSVREFAKYLGKQPGFSDISDNAVNIWLATMIASPATIAGHRSRILALWRAGWQDELIESPPRRVRVVHIPRKFPEAWGLSEMKRLLDATGNLAGNLFVSHVARRDFWRAWLLVQWDTGLRLGDMLQIRGDQLTANSLVLTQGKTGEPLLCGLRPATVEAIGRITAPHRPRVFGDCLSRRHVFQQFRRLRLAAGLPRGGTHQIRRSGATAVEIDQPGQAGAFLGHLTPGLAHRHYIDPRLIGRHRPMPPPLTG